MSTTNWLLSSQMIDFNQIHARNTSQAI